MFVLLSATSKAEQVVETSQNFTNWKTLNGDGVVMAGWRGEKREDYVIIGN